MTKHLGGLLAAFLALALAAAPALAQGKVNIYSYRSPDLIAPILDRFTEETGIETVVLYANQGLIERVKAEGDYSPADLILTVDIGNLALAKSLGITQPIDPDVIARAPKAFKDEDNQWVALSLRARVFYVAKDRVDATALTYDDIAKPEWKGRICTRSGQHVYNIGLIATRIAHLGYEGAKDWLTKVRDNLTGAPSGDDRAQAKKIYSGECDLAIDNTYYMGVMLNNEQEPEQKDWAAASRIVFPDTNGDGTQVNVSGAVLAKNAPNKDNAEKLLKFLLSDEAQQLYANANYEYPVVPGVEPSPLVASWGELHPDQTPLTKIAELRDQASQLVDEVNFDAGPQN